ncbi:MAG: hypothetical protein ABJX32_11375 [Tateyamaria sp.]|uniref:hypothetical protein n=1 Tax=Tateyamaria sp. TaxID=1929288 RepID=UPI00329F817B
MIFQPKYLELSRKILAGFKAQTDAFAEPMPEAVKILMDAMYNESERRLAPQKSLSDFIEFATEAAEAQDTLTRTLPGSESAPIKDCNRGFQRYQAKNRNRRRPKLAL